MTYPVNIQTSPFIYITIDSSSKEKVIYSSLNNQIYQADTKTFELMEQYKRPANINTLINQVGIEYTDDLLAKGILVNAETVWEITNIENLEIETTTHCNWRCEFCPVSLDPKKKSTMPLELFNEIIDKATRHSSIKYVTFNSFNEPTLDTLFEKRIEKLAKTNLKLILHTNGSMLDEGKVNLLKETGVLSVIHFNLPTLEPNEFKRITRSPTYDKTIKNIEYALEQGLNVNFSVQRVNDDITKNLTNVNNINQRFGQLIDKEIKLWRTVDRAGLLKDKYAQNINISGNLYGCGKVLNWMYVGVHGDCFICHHDYYQREVYGNITEGEINEILLSEKSKNLRKKVFGIAHAEDNFICRKCFEMDEFRALSRFSKKIRPLSTI